MKAVKLVIFMMLVLCVNGRQALAQYESDESDASAVQEDSSNVIDLSEQTENVVTDEKAAAVEEATTGELGETEIKQAADALINDLENADPIEVTEEPAQDQETPSAEDMPVTEEAPADDSTTDQLDEAIVNAVKAEISERRKASGKLDIFDANADKVRTLDLIEFKNSIKEQDDHQVVQADFRDTSTGDIVTLDIQMSKDEDVYTVKDMTVASVTQPAAKEVKTEYNDQEVLAFMKEYIDTQSQATGTFDLYDEKAQKMRNLELVSLDEKLRRYGIIAISTAEFTDKNTGDTVKVDVNAENKNGLGITAMRLKSVKKAAPVKKD